MTKIRNCRSLSHIDKKKYAQLYPQSSYTNITVTNSLTIQKCHRVQFAGDVYKCWRLQHARGDGELKYDFD